MKYDLKFYVNEVTSRQVCWNVFFFFTLSHSKKSKMCMYPLEASSNSSLWCRRWQCFCKMAIKHSCVSVCVCLFSGSRSGFGRIGGVHRGSEGVGLSEAWRMIPYVFLVLTGRFTSFFNVHSLHQAMETNWIRSKPLFLMLLFFYCWLSPMPTCLIMLLFCV